MLVIFWMILSVSAVCAWWDYESNLANNSLVPILDSSVVVAQDHTLGLVALKTTNGQVVWALNQTFAKCCSPIELSHTTIATVCSDGCARLLVLDSTKGKILRSERVLANINKPRAARLTKFNTTLIMFETPDDGVLCLDLGLRSTVRWRFKGCSQAVLVRDVSCMLCNDSVLIGVDVGTGEVKWRRDENLTKPTAVASGHLLVLSVSVPFYNAILKLDPATGTSLERLNFPAQFLGEFHSWECSSASVCYAATKRRRVLAFRVSPSLGILWEPGEVRLSAQPILQPPRLAFGDLFVATTTSKGCELSVFDPVRGFLKDSKFVDHLSCSSTPLVLRERIVASLSDGLVVGLAREDEQQKAWRFAFAIVIFFAAGCVGCLGMHLLTRPVAAQKYAALE